MSEKLEKIARRKTEITPAVEKAIQSLLGADVPQIREDISHRLVEGNFDFAIDLALGFRKAKAQFIKDYLIKVLSFTNGNVAEAARIAALDRRTLHRLIHKFKLSVAALRQQPYFFRDDKKEKFVQDVIAEVLEKYDLTKGRYEVNAATAQTVAQQLPEFQLSYDEALDLFEKECLKQALQKYRSQSAAAEALGLRYETVHRKAREYGLLEK